MMKVFIFIPVIFFGMLTKLCAQNNARLLSTNGEVFKVLVNGIAVNKIAEASVLIENINNDTLAIRIEPENKKGMETFIYLLDKGEKNQKQRV